MDSAVGILRGDALAQDIALDHDDRGGYFMALDQTDRAIYLSPTSDTGAIVGGGQTDDKAIIVAIVFGPKSEIDDSDDTTSTLEKVYSSVSPV
jgi:hypothetical protein